MLQGGVTDINTAKAIARKLFMQYNRGNQMERMGMENMLVDTYKVMVHVLSFRTKLFNLPLTMLTSTIRFSILTEMEELQSRISRHLLSNIWLNLTKSMFFYIQVLHQKRQAEIGGGKEVVLEI